MKKCTVAQNNKVGETSSKYGYPGGGDLFIADCNKRAERYAFLWKEFVDFMKSHDVRPDELRQMFARYYEEFIE